MTESLIERKIISMAEKKKWKQNVDTLFEYTWICNLNDEILQ